MSQQRPHDVGGLLTIGQDSHDCIEEDLKFVDTPLLAWEQQCHALFVVLASRGVLGTDSLRRAIEALSPEQYETIL